MTSQAQHIDCEPAPAWSEGFALACFCLLVANLALFAGAALGKIWIIDASGQPIHTDFANLYAAGRLVRDGVPAAAYEWTLHHAAETALLGHDSIQDFGWKYPPTFLIIVGLLAFLPYATAFVVWIAATLPLYLVTIRAIVGDKVGWLVAGAFPCLLPNVLVGQNGFLTASLIGGALILLQREPVLAGLCLGLVTYKPQFIVLFPVVLLAGGYWRAIIATVLTVAALTVITIALFGVSAWVEFFHSLQLTSQALLSRDHAEWYQVQSLFALVRMLGGGATYAWILQLALTGLIAALLCAMWRNTRISFELKASALAAAVPLATPYVYLYDLTVLGVSAAFLLRCALTAGFIPGEIPGLAIIMGLLLIMPVLHMPVGLLIAAILAVLIVRRSFLHKPQLGLSSAQLLCE
jgi:arabinofuranan 3-O-arabinosyltransferase